MEFRRVLFRSQEDEDPLAVVAGFLKDRKLATQPIAIEESVRFFAFDGLRKVLPEARLVSANPVVRGCRMVKTLAELASSEERRVGKECVSTCRSRWSTYHYKKKSYMR